MNLAELSAVVADEAKAFEMIERLRWPNGPVCPHCGATDRIYVLKGVKDKKGRERHGLKKCGHCRKQFTVRVGSIFEDSPIPLGKWILAIHLMCSSKKGISSNQLKRELGVSYQTALFGGFSRHQHTSRPRQHSGAHEGGCGDHPATVQFLFVEIHAGLHCTPVTGPETGEFCKKERGASGVAAERDSVTVRGKLLIVD